jgi:acyl carrier protein
VTPTTPVTTDEIRATVLRVLGEIAPEADLGRLKSDLAFRDQLDLDSMDLLNFVIGLHETLGLDIPEADYPKLATLAGCVEHLASLLEEREKEPRR